MHGEGGVFQAIHLYVAWDTCSLPMHPRRRRHAVEQERGLTMRYRIPGRLQDISYLDVVASRVVNQPIRRLPSSWRPFPGDPAGRWQLDMPFFLCLSLAPPLSINTGWLAGSSVTETLKTAPGCWHFSMSCPVPIHFPPLPNPRRRIGHRQK